MKILEREQNGVIYRICDGFLEAGGVAHGFSTRLGGASEGMWESLNLGTTRGDDPDRVRENYRRFCAAIGADAGSIAMSNQVHGDVVRAVTTADVKGDIYDPEGYEADGLVTDVPRVVLTVFSADCIPILLYDPVRRVVAAVHAGWRGTALGIGARAVEKMRDCYGCRPEHILAAIGPGISACCFETHADVPQAMERALGLEAQNYCQKVSKDKFKVDLKGLNALHLIRSGVDMRHTAMDLDCTACHPQKYWSHRATQGRRGSQAAMIQLI